MKKILSILLLVLLIVSVCVSLGFANMENSSHPHEFLPPTYEHGPDTKMISSHAGITMEGYNSSKWVRDFDARNNIYVQSNSHDIASVFVKKSEVVIFRPSRDKKLRQASYIHLYLGDEKGVLGILDSLIVEQITNADASMRLEVYSFKDKSWALVGSSDTVRSSKEELTPLIYQYPLDDSDEIIRFDCFYDIPKESSPNLDEDTEVMKTILLDLGSNQKIGAIPAQLYVILRNLIFVLLFAGIVFGIRIIKNRKTKG